MSFEYSLLDCILLNKVILKFSSVIVSLLVVGGN